MLDGQGLCQGSKDDQHNNNDVEDNEDADNKLADRACVKVLRQNQHL